MNNLPVHFLSFFKIPDCIAKNIIFLERRFFWGGSDEVRKISTIKCNELEAPIDIGG